jgi:hypothetical protein
VTADGVSRLSVISKFVLYLTCISWFVLTIIGGGRGATISTRAVHVDKGGGDEREGAASAHAPNTAA